MYFSQNPNIFLYYLPINAKQINTFSELAVGFLHCYVEILSVPATVMTETEPIMLDWEQLLLFKRKDGSLDMSIDK